MVSKKLATTSWLYLPHSTRVSVNYKNFNARSERLEIEEGHVEDNSIRFKF
jgi:hypothetical protein